jgi:hypothetical protein
MMMSGLARRFLFTAALAAMLPGVATQGAQAQAFGYPPYGGPPPFGYRDYGPPPGYGPPGYDDPGPRFGPPGRRAGAPFASRRAIAGLLQERGLRLDGPLEFAGPNIVAIGVDPAGRARRFVIDPYDGAVLSAQRLPSLAARPDRGDEGLREDAPMPPRGVASAPRRPPPSSKDQPVWRDEPETTGSIAHSAKPPRQAAGDTAPPETRKPAVQAAAAQAPAAAPETKAAPTGELEPPIPGG